MSDDPRHTRRWRALRARLIAAATTCAICGQLLAKTAPPRSRWSSTVDHIHPVRTHPHLALDPSNCRVTHNRCNVMRENTSRRGTGRAHGGRTSTVPTPRSPTRVIDHGCGKPGCGTQPDGGWRSCHW